MADKHDYIVNRAMQGDKAYDRGDTRSLTEAEAADMVASGALTKKGEKTAEREPTVQHTFGQEPTKYTDYTDPTDTSVTVKDRRALNSALDHDGNGEAGGSLAGAESTRARGAAKRKA